MPAIVLASVALVFGYIGVFALDLDRNDPPRVYIEASESWEIESDPVFGTTDKKGRTTISGGGTKGGAKPRTAETMKRFAEQCKDVIVTLNKEKADFVVMLEHEGGKDLFNKDNKLAVFDKEGDLIASGSFSRPRKAVDTACDAIVASFRRQGRDSQSDK
ncbi:MAG TPA: hypothetical protein VFZ49_07465 [Pyrinomonadaceae bacterium]